METLQTKVPLNALLYFPYSDPHKSKSNKSTNKSFHRQTSIYPDSTQKNSQTDQTATSMINNSIKMLNIPKFNRLDTIKARTQMPHFPAIQSNPNYNIYWNNCTKCILIYILMTKSVHLRHLPYKDMSLNITEKYSPQQWNTIVSIHE